MKGPETKLRNKIILALRKKYPQGFFRHIHGNPYQDAGIPDIIGSINGVFVGMEVKLPGGKGPSDIQAHTISDIIKSGGVAGVIRSIQDGLDMAEKAEFHNGPISERNGHLYLK